jgi:hypothetical protein
MRGAIILAGLLIAAGLAGVGLMGRYEIASPSGFLVYRLDRLTGEVERCVIYEKPPTTNRPSWCIAQRQELEMTADEMIARSRARRATASTALETDTP